MSTDLQAKGLPGLNADHVLLVLHGSTDLQANGVAWT